MERSNISISVKGRMVNVPAILTEGRVIVITGGWLKTATVHDEEWLPGETIGNPDGIIELLKRESSKADIFSFASSDPDSESRFPYYFEWDNVAVIPINSYDVWWKGLSQDTRRNVRLAAKRGVSVRVVEFDDTLVQGIKEIYDETPIRQGRRFWHYGKDFDAVSRENATYLDRSVFIGAYLEDKLIGFIKMVIVGRMGRIMQILSLNEHFARKPANAMIAKAVEVCCEKDLSYLGYCRYVYGTRKGSSITEFKRRNGFEERRFPRYYIPLTLKGRCFLWSGFHKGIREVLPEALLETLLAIRTKFYQATSLSWRSDSKSKAGSLYQQAVNTPGDFK